MSRFNYNNDPALFKTDAEKKTPLVVVDGHVWAGLRRGYIARFTNDEQAMRVLVEAGCNVTLQPRGSRVPKERNPRHWIVYRMDTGEIIYAETTYRKAMKLCPKAHTVTCSTYYTAEPMPPDVAERYSRGEAYNTKDFPQVKL